MNSVIEGQPCTGAVGGGHDSDCNDSNDSICAAAS